MNETTSVPTNLPEESKEYRTIQEKVWHIVKEKQPITIKDISAITGLDYTVVSSAMSTLCKRKLVKSFRTNGATNTCAYSTISDKYTRGSRLINSGFVQVKEKRKFVRSNENKGKTTIEKNPNKENNFVTSLPDSMQSMSLKELYQIYHGLKELFEKR